MRRRAAVVVLVAAAALALAGCDTAVTLAVTVDADGSGSVEVRLAADADAVAAVDAAVADAREVAEGVDVADPLDVFADTVDDLDGWTLADTTDDTGARTVTARTDVAGPGELESVTADLAEALTVPEGRLFGPLELTMADDRVNLDGELAARVDPAAALGLDEAPDEVRIPTAGAESREVVDFADLAGRTPLTVRLEAVLPGQVLDADADEVDGDRAVWHVEPGEVRTVSAVAERPWMAGWVWPAAGGLAAAAMVGLLAALALVRRRRRAR